MAELTFSEGCPGLALFDGQPLWRSVCLRRQNEFSIRARPAKVFDVGASQAVAAHESIDGLSRPAAFDRQCPDPAAQSELTPDHRRRAAAKTVRLLSLDLYPCSAAIGFAGQRHKRRRQPVDRGAAQQIVLRAQIEIAGDIFATGAARALLGFGQRNFPCFLEFAHWFGLCGTDFSL